MARTPVKTPLRSRLSLTAVACCAMVCGTVLLAPVVQASRQDGSAAAVVATIDLERVIESLDSMTSANEELARTAELYQTEIEQRRESLELLQEEIDLLVGTQRDQKLAEAEVLADDLRVYTRFAELKLEEQRVVVLRRIYEDVREAAARLSRANGWDLVLVNDALVDLPPVTGQQELMRQISARRVIYGDTRIDVTDALIQKMNEPD